MEVYLTDAKLTGAILNNNTTYIPRVENKKLIISR
jgi:hypothetical protein